MNTLIRQLARWQPLVTALASAVLLAIAHGFETFGGLAPCTLCLKQREIYWAGLALGLIGMAISVISRSDRARRATAAVLVVVFAYGAYLAAYHAGAEWKWWPGPTTCSGGGSSALTASSMSDLLNGAKVKPPQCDKAAWVWLGLSMAGWNFLISLGLIAYSAAAARYVRPTQ